MTESMKFGPEWLRNLSETPVPSPPPVRYQLADYRYGREEMLALFSPNLTPPDSLKDVVPKGVYIEKAQPPLTLNTMTDEETRMWNRGINSDMVPRSAGKGEGRGGLRGSGGPRGRGRGGTPYFVGRGAGPVGYGDDMDANLGGGGGGVGGGYGGRTSRPFERSQSERERGRDSWSDRNGGENRGGGGGGRNSEGNWRRSRGGGGDEDEWRPSKWSGNSINNYGRTSGGNWRDEESWDIGSHSKGNHHLPEWATEKNSEGGGTFDSSGAFRSNETHMDDEEEVKIKIEPKPQNKQSPDRIKIGNADKKELDLFEDEASESKHQDQTANHLPMNEIKSLPRVQMDNGDPPQPPPSVQPQKPVQQSNQQQLQHQLQPPPSASPQPPQQLPSPQLSSQSSHLQNQQQQQNSQTQHQSRNQQNSPPNQQQPQIQHSHQQPDFPKHREIQQPDLQLDDSLSNMTDDLAADLVAKLMEDEEKQGKQWYYRDPQGDIQGPFSCTEMAEWFQSGYFTLNLLVRRACDPHYAPLGELIKLWGCIPFLPDQHPWNKDGSVLSNQGSNSLPIKDQMLMNHYQQHYRLMMLRQQAARGQVGHKLSHDWLDSPQMLDQVLPPQYQPQAAIPTIHHIVNNNNLRALLAQMQQQQTLNSQQQSQSPGAFQQPLHHQLPQQSQHHGKPSVPPPRTTEEISRKVSDFLRGLQAKSEQQQVAAAAAAAAATNPSGASLPPNNSGGGGLMDSLLGFHHSQQQTTPASPVVAPPHHQANTSIQNLLRQMQATHQNKMQLNSNVDSVWNNGSNWNQWSHLNPKGIKTEQQVLEEQLRAEDERIREELRKHEEAKRHQEVAEEEEKHARREAEELSRRQQEEEELRRKQEASRRAEVERQRKGEEKRKKDEEKRKKDEEKKERERLREEERIKREVEEAKRADLMAKIQRSNWCPPAASNTSILDIQRSEREQQQLLRGLQQQQQQQQQHLESKHKQNVGVGGIQLKWTETPMQLPQKSLADIQAEQMEQLLKNLEKEKHEREKDKVNNTVAPSLGSWSQGLTWGSNLVTPAWQGGVNSSNSMSAGNSGGFWEQINNPSTGGVVGTNKGTQGSIAPQNVSSRTPSSSPSLGSGSGKESKNKAKREEVGVIKLFNNCHNDEFTQWCTQALSNMQSTVDIPTFVGFLRDVESAAEVQEYVREYLGEKKEAMEFARQFVERRNRLTGGGGGPAGLVTNHPQLHQTNQKTTLLSPDSHQQHSSSREDFQQVKCKSKKGKKNRMQKVDTRILGFSTTSAPDRINVGDREYPEDV